MQKIIPIKKLIIIFSIVVGLIFLILFLINLISEQKISQGNNSIPNLPVIIDKSEDNASLGFTAQRKIVRDKNGNFYLAYRKKFNGYYEIFVAKFTLKEGKWMVSGTNSPISSVGNKVAQRVPSIAIDSKDVLHIVWYGADSKKEKDNRQIKYSKSVDNGESWSNWLNIAPVLGYSDQEHWQEHPNIFVGKNDELYVVWEGIDSKNEHQQIKFTMSIDKGQSWDKWRNLQVSSNNSQSRPSIVQGSTGRLHLLMYSTLGNKIQQIQYCYSDDNGLSWSDWENISNFFFDARHISIVIDKKDNLHVAWRSQVYPDGPTQIYYSVMNDNKWQKPIFVSKSESFQFFPNITIDESDIPYIVWMESIEKYNFPKEIPKDGKIYFSYLKSDKFSKAELLSSGDYNFYPNLLYKNNKSENIPVFYLEGIEPSEIIFDQLNK